MKTLLCCIGRRENDYIREFVEYNKVLGFTNICLYDNNYNGEEDFHEVKHATTTADKPKKILGYKQSTTLKDGLTQMWEWAKTQPKRKQFKWENYEIEKGIYTYWK